MDRIEIETGPNPDAAVIWLHGLGADGHDFEPIVPELKLPASLRIRFVFPHAPVRPVTLNMGMRMRAWYDIFQLGGGTEDETGIRESASAVQQLMQEQIGSGINTPRIVLAGFSQGGAIALHTALRYSAPLAGVLALSTYLPLHATLKEEIEGANRKTPIFMAHGLYDDIIPLARAEQSASALKDAGCKVQWQTYPMPHSVCAEEVAAIAAFFRSVLP